MKAVHPGVACREPAVCDASAGRLAHDLGWSAACAASGTRRVCPLAPAIQFVGYDGYPGHGSPRTCRGGCPAHLHISWASPCYGTSGLSPPCGWVLSFPAPAGGDALRAAWTQTRPSLAATGVRGPDLPAEFA